MVWPINFDHKLQLQTVKDGLKAKKIKLPKMIFFLEKQLIKFSCTYGPLSFCKILEKFLGAIQSYEDVPFLGPKWPPNKFFWGKIINIILIYLLVPSTMQDFKKIHPAIPQLWGYAILWLKMAHFPKWDFFFCKPVNQPCFFHSCLSTCQKSKPDINLLVKYSWLKNTEISLAKSHFWL